MYTGFELTAATRSRLEDMFPPKYERFIGHHITHKFGTKDEADVPGAPASARVVGYADTGDGLEGFLVDIDGNTRNAANLDRFYHITWSLDPEKYKPVDTNNMIHSAKKLPNPITISVEPRLFTEAVKRKTLKDFILDG